MQHKERDFQLRGVRLSTLEWDDKGPPVIAIHGWLDNAASFDPLAPLLRNIHLLAMDMVGHGHSEHLPQAADYHLSDSCRWVVALADAMGWERFALIGHSMGAAVASITAAAVPERVSGLVMIDSIGPMAVRPEQEVKRLRLLFHESKEAKPPRPWRDLESAVKIRQRLGRFEIGTDAAMLLARRGMYKTEDGYLWRHDNRLEGAGTHYYSEEQAEAILHNIESPSLLISADGGALTGWRGLEQRIACVPKLRHVVLHGGHHLHMEQPQTVALVINDFIRGLEWSSPLSS
jgi:pimeloyl-ACP methyl ester carboxylesterase